MLRRPAPVSRHRLASMIGLVMLAGLVSGCGWFSQSGPLRIAAIGALHREPDLAPSPLSMADRLLLDATAQGLVSFSAEGQVEAGLAERWTVIDGGRSYIFRLREARWANGARVRAEDVALLLRRRMASPRLRPSMRAEFRAVAAVRAMTGKVIAIDLARPQPALLDLLAQPDMALTGNGKGWGPWRVAWSGSTAALTPVPLMAMVDSDEPQPEESEGPVALLWGSNSLHAVTQFDGGDADAVIGGRYEGWPMVTAAAISRQSIVIDPVDGLFGLAVVADSGPLSDGQVRDAVNMAIDRSRLIGALDAPGWQPRVTLRSFSRAPGAIDPVYPGWIDVPPAERMQRGNAIISDWRRRHGNAAVQLSIALPEGPGSRILFAWLHTDLGAIGIESLRVPLSASADLRLLDEAAPSQDPVWYLRRLDCGQGISCDPAVTRLITAIDATTDATARTSAIQSAEEGIVRHAGFIALAAPLRWTLTSDRTSGIRANIRGRHSLIRLQPSPD